MFIHEKKNVTKNSTEIEQPLFDIAADAMNASAGTEHESLLDTWRASNCFQIGALLSIAYSKRAPKKFNDASTVSPNERIRLAMHAGTRAALVLRELRIERTRE